MDQALRHRLHTLQHGRSQRWNWWANGIHRRRRGNELTCTPGDSSSAPRATLSIDANVPPTSITSFSAVSTCCFTKPSTGSNAEVLPKLSDEMRGCCTLSLCHSAMKGETSFPHASRSKAAPESLTRLMDRSCPSTAVELTLCTRIPMLPGRPKISWGS